MFLFMFSAPYIPTWLHRVSLTQSPSELILNCRIHDKRLLAGLVSSRCISRSTIVNAGDKQTGKWTYHACTVNIEGIGIEIGVGSVGIYMYTRC